MKGNMGNYKTFKRNSGSNQGAQKNLLKEFLEPHDTWIEIDQLKFVGNETFNMCVLCIDIT